MKPVRGGLPRGPHSGPKPGVLEVASDPSGKLIEGKKAPGQVELLSFPHGEKITSALANLNRFKELEPKKVKLEAVTKEDYNHNKEQTARDVCRMSRATPQMRKFARRLLTYEAAGDKSGQGKMPSPAFRSPDQLRPHLTTLMGTGGFRAILSRALALASPEVPWLRGTIVKADGSWEGLEELQIQLPPNEFLEGRVVLLAQLLGLLATFIGANLTLRLVHETWPKVPLNDSDFIKGGKR